MNKRPVIALDVDGVLLDCDGSFARVASDILGRNVDRKNRSYDLTKRYELTQHEADQVWGAMKEHPFGWGGMPALPGAREAFLKLKKLGYALEVVTAIEHSLEDLRRTCLEVAGMVPDGIHCAGSAHASKADILRKLDPVMLVDDRLWHLHEAHFIEHRVWVDHGDDQDGHVVDEGIYHVKSLSQWVDSWALTQNHTRKMAFN